MPGMTNGIGPWLSSTQMLAFFRSLSLISELSDKARLRVVVGDDRTMTAVQMKDKDVGTRWPSVTSISECACLSKKPQHNCNKCDARRLAPHLLFNSRGYPPSFPRYPSFNALNLMHVCLMDPTQTMPFPSLEQRRRRGCRWPSPRPLAPWSKRHREDLWV